jgi:rhodanese-related sulfurtransferase
MNLTPGELRRPERKTAGEGRVVLLVAVLMFGGAIFMLGKAWYEKNYKNTIATEQGSGLADLRFISAENILDRIKKNEGMHFVDVRPRPSFETNHLIDSEWLGLAEIATYSAPTGKLIVVVYDETNSNEALREIHDRFTTRKMTFAFLEGGIRNWMAKGGTVISESNPGSFVDQTKVTTVSPEEVIELERTLFRSVIVDVRSERDYAAGHIPGAMNLPFSRLEKDRSSIPSIGSIFVYGATENDTFQAGTRLFDMGFFGLRIITGGFEAWKAKGLPVEVSK